MQSLIDHNLKDADRAIGYVLIYFSICIVTIALLIKNIWVYALLYTIIFLIARVITFKITTKLVKKIRLERELDRRKGIRL